MLSRSKKAVFPKININIDSNIRSVAAMLLFFVLKIGEYISGRRLNNDAEAKLCIKAERKNGS
jgi:hypothetical protein